jgi:hypothetical protein
VYFILSSYLFDVQMGVLIDTLLLSLAKINLWLSSRYAMFDVSRLKSALCRCIYGSIFRDPGEKLCMDGLKP